MTVLISGLGAGEDMLTAQLPPRAAAPRTGDWNSLYQRQLAQRHQVAPQPHGGEGDSTAANGRRADSERDPRHQQAVVIPVGGHLELQLTTRAATAMLEALSARASASDDTSEETGLGTMLEGNAHEPLAMTPADRLGSTVDSTMQDQRAIGTAGASALQETLGQSTLQRRGHARESGPSDTGVLLAGSLACAPVSQLQHGREIVKHRDADASAPTATVLDLAASQGFIARGSATGAPPDSRQSPHDRQPATGGNTDAGVDSAVQPGRSYGTFPLIVSGQLLELEFVSLASGRGPAPRVAQQIVMSVQPPGMPRIELTARKLDSKVAVTLAATLGGVAEGAGGGPGDGVLDLPALLRRIGWGSLPVELTAGPVGTIGMGALQ